MIAAKHEGQKAADCMNKGVCQYAALRFVYFFLNQEVLRSAVRCASITVCLNSALRFSSFSLSVFNLEVI